MNDQPSNHAFTRRRLLAAASAGAAATLLSACQATPRYREGPPPPTPGFSAPLPYQQMYAAISDEGHEIPAVPTDRIDSRFLRQEVNDPTGEAPNTIVVDTSNHFLYFVGRGGRAMRYGVGLGRAGFEWSGRAEVEWKQKWPRWFPPDEMIERQPELEKYRAQYDPASREWRGGMQAGIMNPLGARALYIYQDGKDTLYRLHGSPEWWSIGKSVSSGCVRLINQDVMDLYERVPEKTPIVVTSGLRVT